jgi:hypothetical protein
MLPETSSLSGKLRPSKHVRLWLFQDWRSRPAKLRLPKEDTKGLYEGYNLGTHDSLIFSIVPPAKLIQAAAINYVQIPRRFRRAMPLSLQNPRQFSKNSNS